MAPAGIKNYLNSRNVCILIGIGLMIGALTSLTTTVIGLRGENKKIQTFLEDQGIFKRKVNIPAPEGSHISACVLMGEEDAQKTEGNLPVVIFVPGANSLKYTHFDKKLRLVQAGYAVMAIEQRGHGESGGYFTMYALEPHDISAVIDYMEETYPQLNTSHVGLIGMSLGGGTSLHAQAIDSRIHASALYHPVSNITDLFETYGADVSSIVGFTPGIQPTQEPNKTFPNWENILEKEWKKKNAINILNNTNTKNLLLLHGTEDKEVRLTNSQQVIDKVNPQGTRDDIQLAIRPTLGHGDNERNLTSFKYALSWLNHFMKDPNVDITNLDQTVENLELDVLNFPSSKHYSKLIDNIPIILAVSLFVLIFGALDPHPWLKKDRNQQMENVVLENYKNEEKAKERKNPNVVALRSSIVLFSFLVSGFYCKMENPTIFYGLVFFPAYIGCFLLLLVPAASKLNTTSNSEWKRDLKCEWIDFLNPSKFRRFFETLIVFGIPLIVWVSLKSFKGEMVLHDVIRPEFYVWVRYLFVFSSLIAYGCLFARDLEFKYSLLLIPLIFIGSLVFMAFVPFQPPLIMSDYINSKYATLYLALVISTVIFGLHLAIEGSGKLTKNKPAFVMILALTITALINWRFFRIL